MAAYLSGSSVKGDSMQTLYLMNPSYAAYNDSSNSGNMVLLSPTAGLANQDLLGNPGQPHQQQYTGFSLPQTVPQQTESAEEIFANRLSNQGYGWNGGNELLFLPASDIRANNQSLSARLSSFNAGQNQASSIISQLDTASLSQSSFHEQVPFIPSGVAAGLSTQSLQTSTGPGQILSLSLSPQQPSLNQLQSFPIQHPELVVNNSGSGLNSSVLENFSNKGSQWMGMGNSLNSLGTSTPILASGFQGQLTGVSNNRQNNVLMGSPKVELYASKYLKLAQQLLNEVVSVVSVFKSGYVNQVKPHSWATPNSFASAYGQEKNPIETGRKDGGALVIWGNGKEGTLSVSALPTAVSESQEQTVENLVELTAADRQELQIKRAKLLAMVDEVDHRYKQYHHQMQMVVASFETTAGLGAARTYTALALQTISKHFKCLKDAIRGQIRAACKALGEDNEMGHARGETSRLRFIDQQLRQQRALQQLGMMPQHPWRPQRGLPERSVSVLRAWLFEHFLHPYPKDSDKVLLARQTGLTRNQVSNWFINARVRLWKPMVEEMYAEEMKDEEDTEGEDKLIGDQADDGGTGVGDGGRKNASERALRQGNVSNFKSEDFVGAREAANEQDNNSIQNKILTSSLSDSLLLPERESMGQGLKRARSDLTADLKMKPYDLHGGHVLAKPGTDDAFGIPSEVLAQDDEQNLGSYGILHLSGINRYSNEDLAATYPNSTAVSLTLGLRHSEGLSVSAVQQGYVHGQSQLHMARRPEGEVNAINFYGMHDISGGDTGNFEVMNLQGRKRFTGHILQQDFA